jgi:iron complex transport system substrate-binding protein
MRICSLLPSITEILFALDLGDSVVAVTHECDWPPEARTRTPVTRSRIQTEGRSSAEIDRQVRERSGSLYDLDADALAHLRPDIIFTQSQCPVCAVDETVVRGVATCLPGAPAVFSFQPACLAEVLGMIDEIGRTTRAAAAARRLVERFTGTIEHVRSTLTAEPARPRVVCLEWTDPPFTCGHWTPELVEIAGGTELLGVTGHDSRRATWAELLAADPDVLLIAPCGFTLERALEEIPPLQRYPEWHKLRAVRGGSVFVTDGSAYFNRPGPRLIETLGILSEVIHPQRFAGLAPPHSFQQLAPDARMSG